MPARPRGVLLDPHRPPQDVSARRLALLLAGLAPLVLVVGAGQPIEFERRASRCPFETEHSELGAGLLDVYELTCEGLDAPIVLYVNMYDPGEPLIPKGLTVRE